LAYFGSFLGVHYKAKLAYEYAAFQSSSLTDIIDALLIEDTRTS